MGTTTTPEPDPENARDAYKGGITYESASGRNDRPRLILDTDQLLGEILKRPGQLFVCRKRMLPIGSGYYTVIEFADGSIIEVQGA